LQHKGGYVDIENIYKCIGVVLIPLVLKELSSIGLPVRVFNYLHSKNISTVKDLDKITISDLKKRRGIGAKTITKTIAIFKKHGITLSEGGKNE